MDVAVFAFIIGVETSIQERTEQTEFDTFLGFPRDNKLSLRPEASAQAQHSISTFFSLPHGLMFRVIKSSNG